MESNIHELRPLRDMTAAELHLEAALVEQNVEQGILTLRAIMGELQQRGVPDGAA